jgi:alpha-tubulin suppressor-like RCC1 family protein
MLPQKTETNRNLKCNFRKIKKMKKIYSLLLVLLCLQSQAQCWQSVSAQGSHIVAKKTDGSLWTWGANNAGQLGDNTTINKNTPTQIGNSNNWQSVSAGTEFSVAIKTDGTLWTWGGNQAGQLGNGTTVNKLIPTQVGSATNWAFVSAGEQHIVAKKTDGTLWIWGVLTMHLDGNGDVIIDTSSNIPTQIGIGFDWTTSKISAGGYHNLALKPNGSLWTWGNNLLNQLGNGNTTSSNIITQIGTDLDWQSVSTGTATSFAIKSNGKLYGWGFNDDGRVGDGTTNQVGIPTQIGTATNWSSVEGGNTQSIGLRTNGDVYAWGANSEGQLGDGTTTDRLAPTFIDGDPSITAVTSGDSQTYALGGELAASGYNFYGTLGIGTNTNTNTHIVLNCPTSVLGVSSFNENDSNLFSIFPNPTKEFLSIQNLFNNKIDKVIIIDITGKKILEQKENISKLNVSNLTNGLYIIQVYSENVKYQSKFIKS